MVAISIQSDKVLSDKVLSRDESTYSAMSEWPILLEKARSGDEDARRDLRLFIINAAQEYAAELESNQSLQGLCAALNIYLFLHRSFPQKYGSHHQE